MRTLKQAWERELSRRAAKERTLGLAIARLGAVVEVAEGTKWTPPRRRGSGGDYLAKVHEEAARLALRRLGAKPPEGAKS